MDLHVHWYPGHMARARRELTASLPQVDAILEVADARAPASSRNPVLSELAGDKHRVLLLARDDLADPQVTKEWLRALRARGECAVAANLRQGGWIAQAVRLLRRGIGRSSRGPLRTMVVGIPNVGKSTAINALARRRGARTGAVPGVTRGPQWITGADGIQWLDTPGLLWPRLDDPQVRFALAATGAVPDRLLDVGEVARRLIEFLLDTYPDALPDRYGAAQVPATSSPRAEGWLQHVGRRRNLLTAGGAIDESRTAQALVDDFRSGRLGRLSLERPDTP